MISYLTLRMVEMDSAKWCATRRIGDHEWIWPLSTRLYFWCVL